LLTVAIRAEQPVIIDTCPANSIIDSAPSCVTNWYGRSMDEMDMCYNGSYITMGKEWGYLFGLCGCYILLKGTLYKAYQKAKRWYSGEQTLFIEDYVSSPQSTIIYSGSEQEFQELATCFNNAVESQELKDTVFTAETNPVYFLGALAVTAQLIKESDATSSTSIAENLPSVLQKGIDLHDCYFETHEGLATYLLDSVIITPALISLTCALIYYCGDKIYNLVKKYYNGQEVDCVKPTIYCNHMLQPEDITINNQSHNTKEPQC
jgi:hypothetical protein